MNHLHMLDLNTKLKTLGAEDIILDVRGPDEYQAGHLPHSLNIPHDQVQNHVTELKKYKTIYIHCHAGRRAEVAAQVLSQAGFKNLICISGSGMKDWLSAGLPVTK